MSTEPPDPEPPDPGAPDPELPDRVRVHPCALAGEVTVPGDKSISHRVLIVGAVADGPVALRGLAASGDVRSTARCIRGLGADVELSPGRDGQLEGRVEGPLREASEVLDCGNSGTAMRLLSGVAAGVDGLTVLTGDRSLRSRPMDRVLQPLSEMGAEVDGRDGGRLPPITIRGGDLAGITWDSPVASAQVKSCLLLAGLTAEDPTTVRSPARSRDHTERLLAHLGIEVEVGLQADGEVAVLHPGRPRARPLAVPRDPSAAAFWLVAAACGRREVTAPGICVNPTRTGFLSVLDSLGAAVGRVGETVESGEPVADVTVGAGLTGGTSVGGQDAVDSIDELPVLALAGAMSSDGLEVHDAEELRVKESDRIASVAAAMRALDMRIETRPDGYRVPGDQRPGAGVVDARGDHRIAMTACIAGTVATGPVEVRGMRAVTTSYPGFLADMASLGGEVEPLGVDRSG